LKSSGLKIRTPETICDVTKNEIPAIVKRFGGQAVIKVPYSNAGQGVYTIVNKEELQDFMQEEFEYKRFIVQSLIGHYNWSSKSKSGKYYHLGTIPDVKGETYVFDLRMMVCATPSGFRPLSCLFPESGKTIT
jgi:putative transposon-encoded protein